MSVAKKPNILLITADQHRGDCFGFAGRKIKTPHLDRLALNGTSFDACITPNPVCQPARASILTGMLPLTHGVCDNGIDLDEEVGNNGFAGTLAKHGYETALIGKAHFSTKNTFKPTGRPECKTSSKDYGPDWFGPYMGFKHVEMTDFGHWHKVQDPLKPPFGLHYDRWFFEMEGSEELFALWRSGDEHAPQTWFSQLPVAFHNSTWIADRTIEYLADQKREAPFCMWVSFPDPHHPFDCPEPWSRLHSPDTVDLPRHRTKDLENRPWWHERTLQGKPELKEKGLLEFRQKVSRVGDLTDDQLSHMIANYYGMISLIDHNVGRIINKLEDEGLAEDTIVIYTSDHGDWLGDHGLYLKGPMPYEGLLRVGLIVTGPEIPQDKVVTEPVSTIDIAATLYDYCGTGKPEEIQSQSLRPLIENQAESRDVAYCEWNLNPSRTGVPLELRTVRTKTHKLTMELISGAGEMYDLVNDPEEMINLFEDPKYRSVRKDLENLINERPGEILDTFSEPVGMA